MKVRLIVGLGNPGKDLALIRHSAGAWFIEACAARYKIDLQKHDDLSALVGVGIIGNIKFPCAITITPINNCGATVERLSELHNIPTQEILVVHDDLSFLPGIARFKFIHNTSRSLHNGIRNINQHLRTNEFNRLSIGIGHPGIKAQVPNYVMSPPDAHEREKIDTAVQDCLDCLPDVLEGNWNIVMNAIHSRRLKPNFRI